MAYKSMGLSYNKHGVFIQKYTRIYNKSQIYYMLYSEHLVRRREGNVLFNDTLNTFYLRLHI